MLQQFISSIVFEQYYETFKYCDFKNYDLVIHILSIRNSKEIFS